jgi:RNA polymerase sigma-70 factor (ECF subfamily)
VNAEGSTTTNTIRNGAPIERQHRGETVERDLVEAAQRGDREAYVDLIRTRADRLYALAYRIVRDVDGTQDAFQDALVIAWRDLPALRDPARFDAWLRRLFVHACLEHAVRERRRVANLRALPVDGPAGPDGLLSVALRDELERGFRRLPPMQRAILVLHHYVGYAPSEIAELLGIPNGTARSRLHNAHRAMRAALDADARGELVGGRPA